MAGPPIRLSGRRQFLRMLAASPAFPYLALSPTILKAFEQELFKEGPADTELIASAAEALTVFDFEAVAKKKLHVGHVALMAGSDEHEGTYRANREGFDQYQLRVRRLVDVSKTDMSVSLFGIKMQRPIILCPIGAIRAFHPEGAVAVARAAKTKGYEQVLANFGHRVGGAGSHSIEEVTAAKGGPVWYQVSPDRDWNHMLAMIKRAEAAGSPVLVLMVTGQGSGSWVGIARVRRKNRQFCGSCHQLPNNYGTDIEELSRTIPIRPELGTRSMPTKPLGPPMMVGVGWDYVKRLKDATKLKVVVKGIVTREDAELALENGADGVWISNHGGRMENSLRSTVECVPEVAAAVRGRAPIIVDSGFRKGTDIFKALALGATAVGVGRPYIYGLASFGQEGVEAVMDILDSELKRVMRQAGTTSVAKITREYALDRLRRTI